MFAAADIPEGRRILKIDDSRVVTDESPLREEEGEYERHCDYLAEGKVVLMQKPERYINHSCSPNVYVETVGETRYVVAQRDVRQDDEITYDYCIDASGADVWECNCGSPECREINHDFFDLPMPKQLEYLEYLSPWFQREHRDRVEKLKRKTVRWNRD
ncbi:MAG: SET domain-containing protein-lysine N-methyltransferase [Thermoplasmata archaeon]